MLRATLAAQTRTTDDASAFPQRSPGQCLASQVRLLHTSKPVFARGSFRSRIQNKVQKFRDDPNAMQKLMGVGAMGYSVAKVSKFGAVLKFAFPILKLAKVMPLMSMCLSTMFYSWFFGFPFAIGIVSIMFSSQASRAMLLSKFGCEVRPMTMIPFVGTMDTSGEDRDYTKTEEYVLRDKPFERCLVALAPVAGIFAFTASVPLGVGGLLLDSQCGFAVANTGFMMGMFSQLPLGEMTPGGLLLSHFSKRALLYGTVFNAALLTVLPNPILFLCLFMNMYRLYQRGFMVFGRQFGGEDTGPNFEAGSGVSATVFNDKAKVIIASLYWALFILNAGGLTYVSKSLRSPQTLRQQQQREERERHVYDEVADPRYAYGQSADGIGAQSGGGWNLGDWALDNLNTVEQLDKDEDDFDREWRRQQQFAQQRANAMERGASLQ